MKEKMALSKDMNWKLVVVHKQNKYITNTLINQTLNHEHCLVFLNASY
jgi:hypothetical protein